MPAARRAPLLGWVLHARKAVVYALSSAHDVNGQLLSMQVCVAQRHVVLSLVLRCKPTCARAN